MLLRLWFVTSRTDQVFLLRLLRFILSLLFIFHIGIVVVVFPLLLILSVLLLLAAKPLPRVSAELLIRIEPILMVLLAEELISLLYVPRSIARAEEQLDHFRDLAAYLRVRVHLELGKGLETATGLEEIPDGAFALKGEGAVVLEEAKQGEENVL